MLYLSSRECEDVVFALPKMDNVYYRIKPAVLRQATYGTIKFGIYYSLKQMLVHNPGEEHLGINIFCAVTAGKLM